MNIPVMTQDLALQLEQAKAEHLDSWLQGMQKYPDKFSEIDILRIGNLRVLAAPSLQEIGLFNQTIGLNPQNKELLEEIRQFYHDHSVERYNIEVNPYHASADFLRYLASHGFAPSRFETYLYGIAENNLPSSPTLITVLRS